MKNDEIKNQDRATPPFPLHCRVCNSKLDCLPYLNSPERFVDEQGRECRVICYDIYDGTPRTFEYDVVCNTDPKHTALKVVETPANNFRVVIQADRYDEKRVRR